MEEVERRRKEELERELAQARLQHDETSATAAAGDEGGSAQPQGTPDTFVREGRKVGRNEPCPCGSGKKYKQCHGKVN
jgi:preprotein translocase subunit SecA